METLIYINSVMMYVLPLVVGTALAVCLIATCAFMVVAFWRIMRE